MENLTLLLADDGRDPAGAECAAYLDGLAGGLAAIGRPVRRVSLAEAVAAPEASVLLPDSLVSTVTAAGGTLLGRSIVLVLRPLPQATGAFGAALRAARGVVAASSPLHAALRELSGLEDRLLLLPPGSSAVRPAIAAGSPSAAPCTLLSCGAAGTLGQQTVLIEALAGLRDLDWRLRIGAAEREPGRAALEDLVAAHALTPRVRWIPAAIGDAVWSATDVFLRVCITGFLAAPALQALRHGVPVALSAPMAVVPPKVGVAVPAGDAAALSRSLRRMICDDRLRGGLGEAARALAETLPEWPMQARRLQEHLAAS